MSDVPIEDEYVLHITIQIIAYFTKLGFNVIPIPISRVKEKLDPYDWKYELKDLNKVFMLQFKRPNPRDSKISWDLNQNQHNTMRNKPHIFYCLPKSKDRSEMPVMLYKCLFKRATFDFERVLRPIMLRYCDGWGSFASKVLECKYGIKIQEDEKEEYEIPEDIEKNSKENGVGVGVSFSKKKIKIFVNEKMKEMIDKK